MNHFYLKRKLYFPIVDEEISYFEYIVQGYLISFFKCP